MIELENLANNGVREQETDRQTQRNRKTEKEEESEIEKKQKERKKSKNKIWRARKRGRQITQIADALETKEQKRQKKYGKKFLSNFGSNKFLKFRNLSAIMTESSCQYCSKKTGSMSETITGLNQNG